MARPKKYPPITIILLGDPAAGKATQAAYLAKEYNLYDLDMGKELTRVRRQNATLSKELNKNYDQGKLTPTKICREIFKDKITNLPASQGILFDGGPKMLGEAQLVSRLLTKQHRVPPVVIYLSIPMEETVKRMHDRVGYFAGKFGKRTDDNDAALKNRVKYYRKNIAEVIEFFSGKYEFHKISALGTRKQVQKKIEKIVKQYLKRLGNA